MAANRLSWERTIWDTGCSVVAGVDEVGRGALAGPLVAAAVAFDPAKLRRRLHREMLYPTVRDSKLLTRAARVRARTLIEETALGISIGIVECFEIDAFGMSAANRIAMERAVASLRPDAEFLYLDAFVIDLGIPQIGLIDGDARCFSVAAASIVAKVTRDAMMAELHEHDGRFGFNEHSGYGTPAHLDALKRHGPSAAHRMSFAPVREWFQ